VEPKLNLIELYVKPYLKSILAFVVPFAGNLLAAGQEDSHSGSTITGHEWTESFLLALVAAAAVWGVANTTRAQSLAKKTRE
jgi:drug/metabolite transporter (DMT)-like permease